MNLLNHTVFITGGSSGIGLALAKKFADLGNKVIICGRNTQKLQAVLDKDERLTGIVADITAPKAISYILNICAKNKWYPSIIVNNAGCGASIDILSGNADHFMVQASNQIQTNIQAPMNLVVAFLPILKTHPNAAIINITSGLAISPKKSSPIYCATKAALRAFTKSLRYQIEDAKLNIRVMEVLPPVVDTPMTVCHEYKGGSYEANIKFKLVCNYIRDGGRPSEIVLQEKISNYSKLLYVKSYGGER